jgi:NarL family two-component system response regulator LiaR
MEHSACIRVFIVTDHAVTRTGLATFLLAYADLALVGAAAHGPAAVRLCAELRPDVAVIDLVLPQTEATTTIRAIRQSCPHTQVVALVSFGDEALVQAVLEAGALSCLSWDTAADRLAEAIRATHAGRPTLAPEAARALIHAATHTGAVGHDLTRREHEVLHYMIAGLSNPAIAARLAVSRSTVKFHVSSILAKLGVTSRTEAVALALQHHLAS